MPNKTVNLGASTTELAELMKSNPSAIEKELTTRGENLVGLFQDNNFTNRRFNKLNEMKVEVLKKAIEDIGAGVLLLRSSTMGVSFADNHLVAYAASHGTSPKGNVVFSVSWKNIAAFKAWRSDGSEDVLQEDINAAIYFLISEISKLI